MPNLAVISGRLVRIAMFSTSRRGFVRWLKADDPDVLPFVLPKQSLVQSPHWQGSNEWDAHVGALDQARQHLQVNKVISFRIYLQVPRAEELEKSIRGTSTDITEAAFVLVHGGTASSLCFVNLNIRRLSILGGTWCR